MRQWGTRVTQYAMLRFRTEKVMEAEIIEIRMTG